ncbi:dihydrofolate reductase family protein [Streptomyces sp. NBC_00841]|uniref:dihydrofolate reductase family protein n=1 Tax=unclassified Streptomyces TaxID=2593676 RepID=UPI00225825A8|nr:MULTISPECIES: dihydrofolate reductase family protein [unclassified Streptomyces]MCX4531637.1 dihydrofolate reductase family protein [Streptomyces sp. NBC_01669]WSA02794.1 dihydrofolate reductase family protein [Streptomyces sp. NBC_00841]
MAKLTLTTFLSLDGVMQAPGRPDEDRSGGFEYGGWLAPFMDQGMGQFMTEVFDRSAAFLLGRRTYDIFAAYWPKVTDPDDPIACRLNPYPKYVVSTTLEKADWENTTVVSADVAEEVARIKERTVGGELQIHGSGALAQSLMAHDLIDEYNLLTYPVVLGRGRRLFPEGGLPTAFRLTGARITPKGIAIHTYRPVGRARFGSVDD